MYQFIQQILFFFRAQTAHGLHSPLVFELYTKVINPNLWPFKSDKFQQDLKKFQLSKFELKDKKLLIINNLEELINFNPEPNQLILITNPYRNLPFQSQVINLSKNNNYHFIVHFFKGTILISAPLAPRQEFYLKHMQ
jgi:maltodextrin utilization protein YvdJ